MNIYQTDFLLMYVHKMPVSDLDRMMPWERTVYIGLLNAYIEEENKRIEDENRKMQNR